MIKPTLSAIYEGCFLLIAIGPNVDHIFGAQVVEDIIIEYTKKNPNTTQALPKGMTAGRNSSAAAPSASGQAVAAVGPHNGDGYRFQSGGSGATLTGALKRLRHIIAPRNSSVNIFE